MSAPGSHHDEQQQQRGQQEAAGAEAVGVAHHPRAQDAVDQVAHGLHGRERALREHRVLGDGTGSGSVAGPSLAGSKVAGSMTRPSLAGSKVAGSKVQGGAGQLLMASSVFSMQRSSGGGSRTTSSEQLKLKSSSAKSSSRMNVSITVIGTAKQRVHMAATLK